MSIRIGTSGYQYRHWRGILYPAGLPQRDWLPWFARFFDTVELNATFYRLPTEATVVRWAEITPRRFLFAVKGSRYLTHLKRLLDDGAGVSRFFAPVARFGRKLGPILWQLPPRMKPDPQRLESFLARLPRGRHAVEFRDPGWYADEVCDVLDRHGAAFCEHDHVRKDPPRLTGGWRYLRFHGTTGRYAGRYGRPRLRGVADDLLAWSRRGRDAFVYFNNDTAGHALYDALDLLALVGEERPALDAQALAP